MHSRAFSVCRLRCRYVLFIAGDVAFTDEGKRRVQMLTEAMYIAGTRSCTCRTFGAVRVTKVLSASASGPHARLARRTCVRLLQVATVAEASLPYPPNSCTS